MTITMRKALLYGLMAGTLIIAAGCNGTKEDPKQKVEIVVDKAYESLFSGGIKASRAEGEYEIGFTAPAAWSISAEQTKAPASWISFTPSSGASGKGLVKIKVQENSSTDTRSATITISSGGVTKTLTLEQAALLAQKAKYEDFLGDWIVTGTEHKYFLDWDGRTELHTFSYAISILEEEKGKSYYIENWETGATAQDRQYLYYGSDKHADKTGGRSITDYYLNVVGKSIDLAAWYDAQDGTLHIDRQTFYTGSDYTIEFLGSTQVGDERAYARGQFAANVSETDKYEYTICDFVMLEGGTVLIKAHEQTNPTLNGLAFMGYCQYWGWYPNTKYYNSQFAFPYTMVKK